MTFDCSKNPTAKAIYELCKVLPTDEIVRGSSADLIYYINPDTGKDSNPGTDAEPFEHIQHAIDLLPKIIGHNAIILLQDSLNYNENLLIEGFVKTGSNTYFGIYSVSYDATKVLVSSPIASYETIKVKDCSAPVFIGYISVRVQKDGGACVSIENTDTDIVFCKMADNDNLNTKGIYSLRGGNVYIHEWADYDTKKR